MAHPLLDPSLGSEAHVGARLAREPILWFTTVSSRGGPHTVPVWFAWSDPTVTIFSRPGTVKLSHLTANPAVSIALDSAGHGADIVVGEGRAELVGRDAVREAVPAFAAKYQAMLGGSPVEEWFATFSQALVVTVERLIAWTTTADGVDYRSLPRQASSSGP